ncbi:hypothetical protein R3P38DRAFT_2815443 [Favolaschia claudopus]|uniref:Uncharacterized protein n=1 Tax=Favolaschia claudopus TaxID=2862362 RepID=A0AAV9Z1C9_9AGAR
MFSTTTEPDSLHHARPFLSTWATRLVAAEARKQIGFATVEDPDDDESHVRLRASSNGSGYTTAHVVTWNDFANFSVEALAEKFLVKLSLPMFLTQFMAAPKVDGDFFVRKRRPHPMIQVAALGSSSFPGILTQPAISPCFSASGTLLANQTARTALISMTDADTAEMRAETEAANIRGEVEHATILDNVQEYDYVYEQGIVATAV